MQHIHGVTNQLESFIRSKDFFYYHGIVLAFLWFVASTIAILLRKASVQLHALCFFLIDFITAFFIIGALIRVYPYIGNNSWSLVKQGHIYGGIVFLLFLIIQHASGVYTFLKGINYNPIHRKLGVVVSSLGKFLAVGGMIIADWPQYLIIIGAVLAVLMTAFGTYKHFGGSKKNPNSGVKVSSSPTERQRSPPREVKRD